MAQLPSNSGTTSDCSANSPLSPSAVPNLLVNSESASPSSEAKKVDYSKGLFDSRVLCLHYYSDALKFQFGEEHEEVYRMDQIKEWADLDPLWLDTLKETLGTGN